MYVFIPAGQLITKSLPNPHKLCSYSDASSEPELVYSRVTKSPATSSTSCGTPVAVEPLEEPGGKTTRRAQPTVSVEPASVKAYMLKESLERLWDYRYEGAMVKYLGKWVDQLRWQRLPSFQKLATMLIKHLDGILNYCRTKVIMSLFHTILQKGREMFRGSDDITICGFKSCGRIVATGCRGYHRAARRRRCHARSCCCTPKTSHLIMCNSLRYA